METPGISGSPPPIKIRNFSGVCAQHVVDELKLMATRSIPTRVLSIHVDRQRCAATLPGSPRVMLIALETRDPVAPHTNPSTANSEVPIIRALASR